MTRHLRPAVVFFFLAAWGTALLAIPRQQAPQRPTRDTSAQVNASGTASIAGIVLDYTSGRPVKRARIQLTAAELPQPRTTQTDEGGRYVVTELPAGRYQINVSKAGYVNVSWGQRRPGRVGRPFPVTDGQQAKNVDFRLPRGSVVTGRVLDEGGEPLLGASVQAMRYQYVQGQQRLVPAGADQSDDRGQYRIYGLMPGYYVISATARPERGMGGRGRGMGGGGFFPQAENDPYASLDYAPTYYPGVTSVAQATIVPVNVTQEVANLDFLLQLVTTAQVSGMVVGADGSAAAGAQVVLQPDEGRAGTSIAMRTYSARARPDGTFLITNVPPGRYAAVARNMAGRGRGGGGAVMFGRQTITVAGQDLMGVSLTLVPGATISGTVTCETGGTPAPSDLSRVRVSASALVPVAMDSPDNTRAAADGTFTLSNVGDGQRLLHAAGLQSPWTLKGIYLNGRDVADLPVEFKSGQRVNNVSIVFTDHGTTLTATVPDANGQPLTDYLAVAFSNDQAYWLPQSRRIQQARPDADGTCTFRGLPPGEYLVVALDDVEQGAWYDPAFLDQIRPSAVRVALADGDTKSVELKLTVLER